MAVQLFCQFVQPAGGVFTLSAKKKKDSGELGDKEESARTHPLCAGSLVSVSWGTICAS